MSRRLYQCAMKGGEDDGFSVDHFPLARCRFPIEGGAGGFGQAVPALVTPVGSFRSRDG